MLRPTLPLLPFIFGYSLQVVSSDVRIATLAGPSTASPEAWTTADSWIQDRLQNHTACNDNHGVEFCYPARLLDVGQGHCASDVVRLIETLEQLPQGAYMTLSHCWGEMPFLCTTKENLVSIKAGFHVSELAQTFQDAIVVTRRLKVRYLWIDSLCIIQDKQDLSDWNSESVKMESYYSNAFCNLAATASLNGPEGLFRCRDPERLQHMQYAMSGSKSRRAGLYNIFDITLWEKELTQAPLHRRAWVLQERLLARRVLHFGSRQLMWECHEHTAAEFYPHGIKDVSPLVQRAHFKDLDCYSPWNRAELKSDDPRTLTLRIWERIANQYSQFLLTYPSDRVKALDGIARRFKRMLDDECLFGMWKRDMATQLLWRVEGGGLYPPSNSLYTEQRQYAVPTWSWLSADCAIDTGKLSELRQLQPQDILLEVVMPLANLHITAILGQHGLWRVKKAKADNNNIQGYTKKHQLILSQDISIDRYIPGVNEVGDSVPLTCVPVRVYRRGNPSQGMMESLECLLVRPLSGCLDTFQRVGTMEVDGHENIDHFLDPGWDGAQAQMCLV
ncbi:hypothetical protein KC330_g8878 [Hortaea werneckii]|nr:hypothetical protein KC330_g8878 [Hortaea werneckii]